MNRSPLREITEQEISAYETDGIVCLRGLFDNDWVDHLRYCVDADLNAPGPLAKDITRGKEGVFVSDTFVWANIPEFEPFIRTSPAAEAVATVMRSSRINLLFDQILVKEPGSNTRTMWHHDHTYWPVAGDQVCTLWIALDPVTAETGAVEYIRGSHRWGTRYKAQAFVGDGRYKEDLPEVPDIGAMRDELEILQFEMEPGDCTVHHGLLVHGAPGNTSADIRRRAYVTRWCGDDVTYNPRPNIQPMLYDPDIAPGGPLDCDLFPVVWPQRMEHDGALSAKGADNMRAVICKDWCAFDDLRLGTATLPEMRGGGVRIAIEYAGVSFATTLVVAGEYQRKPPLPFIPGTEIAGVVLECADGVTKCKPGDRVLAPIDWGGYAEQVVASEHNVQVVPDGLPLDAAVALCISYPTSFGGLCWRANLARDETLLVHGAAGGVGLAAVEIGRAIGANVIAVANGDEKQKVLKERGIDHVIETKGFRDRVDEITSGEGVDVVFDPVGGSVSRPSISTLRPGGRLVTIGYAAGEIPTVGFNILLVKNVSVMGFNWGEYVGWSPNDRRAEHAGAVAGMMDTLFGWWQEGKISPSVHARFDLTEFREAMNEVRNRRAIGRVVIQP